VEVSTRIKSLAEVEPAFEREKQLHGLSLIMKQLEAAVGPVVVEKRSVEGTYVEEGESPSLGLPP